MANRRYMVKSVKGFKFKVGKEITEWRGLGIFDKQEQKFVKMGDEKPYTPWGGRSTALEVATMCENNEIIGGVQLIAHM